MLINAYKQRPMWRNGLDKGPKRVDIKFAHSELEYNKRRRKG